MGKRIELEGKDFGLLHVETYIGAEKYHCRCECGNEVDVFGYNLTSGHTTSCGCKKKIANLTGKVYGYLKAIERDSGKIRGNQRRVSWKCLCTNCGKEITVYADELTSGQRKSCGCIRKGKGMPEKIRQEFTSGTQLSKIQSSPTKSNKSGVVGVNWDKSRNKWQASIKLRGKKYHFGRFERFEDAVKARREAEKEIFNPLLGGTSNDD